MKKLLTLCFACSTLFLSISSQAKVVELDRVAAVVNDSVILESDIQDLIITVKSNAAKNSQALPSDNALRVQVIDKLIDDTLILGIGERVGVQVSDAQLDETLTNIAAQSQLTVEQFRENIIAEGTSFERYRESLRKELIISDVRRNSVRRRVYISPQEVESLIQTIKDQSEDKIEYHLGHILIEFPANVTQEEVTASKERADKVVELLNNGSDFAKIALASSGDNLALKGGDFGWKTINEMPTVFAELVDGQAKGDIFGPIRTGLGYSIVKILDQRGKKIVEVEEVEARHILITPSIILSEEKAQETLQNFLDKIAAGEADFGELAKEHSDGPSGVKGGELGWSDPNNYDPAFRDALAAINVDEYTTPFRSSFGWHIAQLTGRRILDATDKADENNAYQIIYQRKFAAEAERWLKESRDQAYVEIFDLGDI